MCKIKTGANIKTRSDIMNLITALLFRQLSEFTVDSIFNAACYYLKDSQFDVSHDDLEKMILRDIDAMQRNQEIECIEGKYMACGID